MKLEIPNTSYWHQLTNEEKREVMSDPSVFRYYECIREAESDPFLIKRYPDHKSPLV